MAIITCDIFIDNKFRQPRQRQLAMTLSEPAGVRNIKDTIRVSNDQQTEGNGKIQSPSRPANHPERTTTAFKTNIST